jgi:hypothetical protein
VESACLAGHERRSLLIDMPCQPKVRYLHVHETVRSFDHFLAKQIQRLEVSVHQGWLQGVHEVHAESHVQRHFVSLSVGQFHAAAFLMKHLEQRATMAELSDDDWLSLLCHCTPEQEQVRIAEVSQCLYFSLVLSTKLSVLYKALHLQLFDSHIIQFVLGFVNQSSRSLPDLGHILELTRVDLEGIPSSELVVQKLNGKVFFLRRIRNESILLLASLDFWLVLTFLFFIFPLELTLELGQLHLLLLDSLTKSLLFHLHLAGVIMLLILLQLQLLVDLFQFHLFVFYFLRFHRHLLLQMIIGLFDLIVHLLER